MNFSVAIGLMADGLLRPFFGLSLDRFGFKKNYVIVSIFIIFMLATISFTRCLVPAYLPYVAIFLSMIAFENIMLAATVSQIFGLHSGG